MNRTTEAIETREVDRVDEVSEAGKLAYTELLKRSEVERVVKYLQRFGYYQQDLPSLVRQVIEKSSFSGADTIKSLLKSYIRTGDSPEYVRTILKKLAK